MEEKTFLEKMMNLLDLEEEPAMDAKLEDFEDWDSLAYVTFLSMANKVSATRIPPESVQKAKTFSDLFALVKKG